MRDVSLGAVEASKGRVLGSCSIGDATIAVEASIDEDLRDRDVGVLLREIQSVARARSELEPDERPRAVADGSGLRYAEIPLDTAEALLGVTDAILDDVDELLDDQEAVDELGLARDELAAAVQEARPAVATDGGEDLDLTPGEDAAYCPDCEQWLPCDCDGIPADMEIRPFDPDGPEAVTDGGRGA